MHSVPRHSKAHVHCSTMFKGPVHHGLENSKTTFPGHCGLTGVCEPNTNSICSQGVESVLTQCHIIPKKNVNGKFLSLCAPSTMSQELYDTLSKLNVKNILTHFEGKLSFSCTQQCSKDALVMHIMSQAPREDLELLTSMVLQREIRQENERQEREVLRKCCHADQQYGCRVAARLEVDDIENTKTSSIDDFLCLPTPSQAKECYCAFYEVMSNKGL